MASRAFLEKAKQKGRKISPEVIQQVFDSVMGAGIIKSITGLSNIGIRFGSRFPVETPKGTGIVLKELERASSRANVNLPVSLGTGLRRNIGGKRPPNSELEALALRKQQAQKATKFQKETTKHAIKTRTRIAEQSPAKFKRLEELEKLAVRLKNKAESQIAGGSTMRRLQDVIRELNKIIKE